MFSATLVALLTVTALANASAVKVHNDVDMMPRWAQDTTAAAVTVTVTESCTAGGAPTAPSATTPTALATGVPATSAPGAPPVPEISSAPTASVTSSLVAVASSTGVVTPTGSPHPSGTASTPVPEAMGNAATYNGVAGLAVAIMAANVIMGI